MIGQILQLATILGASCLLPMAAQSGDADSCWVLRQRRTVCACRSFPQLRETEIK